MGVVKKEYSEEMSLGDSNDADDVGGDDDDDDDDEDDNG